MGNETWAVYNPRLLDDIPAWVIENIQAVSAYMKTRGHEEWTIAGVRSQSAHAREVEALRMRAEAAEADARRLAALERDAARYKWLRKHLVNWCPDDDTAKLSWCARGALDAEIDAAIASGGEDRKA